MPPQERTGSKPLQEWNGTSVATDGGDAPLEAGDVRVGVPSSSCASAVAPTASAKTAAAITGCRDAHLRGPARRPPPLRVCCYGSSSSSTPEKFLSEAYALGRILAVRGHTCVNGAGAYGCMAAMNEGAADHGGSVVGVIHEMFMVDGNDWASTSTGTSSSRGGKWAHLRSGAHRAFDGDDAGGSDGCGGRRELLVAGGSDLRERKRLLVEGADALVVLPGGPGTWDELMEMACARNVGLSDLPIVCVNVDGYYDPFRTMLRRSADECLIKHDPAHLIHFEPTSALAVDWVERQLNDRRRTKSASSRMGSMPKRRTSSLLRARGRGSAMGDALVRLAGDGAGWWVGGVLRGGCGTGAKGVWRGGGSGDGAAGVVATFSAGFALGIGVAMALTTMGGGGVKSR